MKLIITNAAERDLAAIADWISEDDPERAQRFVREILAAARRLCDAPRGYPLLPRYARHGLRRRSHHGYLLIYRVKFEAVELLHVIHAMRDYETLLDREFAGD